MSHTQTQTDVGPDYCHECSSALGDWVRWPCKGVHDHELLAWMGTDASRWAQAYVARFGGDENNMLGWFANAIMAGHDSGALTITMRGEQS